MDSDPDPERARFAAFDVNGDEGAEHHAPRGTPIDLADFGLSDVAACGGEIRRIGSRTRSMEEAARNIVRLLRDRFVNPRTARPSFVMARFFLCLPFERLEPALQDEIKSSSGHPSPQPKTKCFALLASAGDVPEWNSRHHSSRHKAIPFFSADSVASVPMIARLISQFGFDAESFLRPDQGLFVAPRLTACNVFHVTRARGSSHLPDQDGFVRPHAVRSVVGFGGVLPSDDLFAVVLFSRDPIHRRSAAMFKPLALNTKVAVLPFDRARIFDVTEPQPSEALDPVVRRERRKGWIGSLEPTLAAQHQLLEAQDVAAIEQSRRLEEALRELRAYTEDLELAGRELVTQKSALRSILDSMSDGVVVVDAAGRFVEFNPGARRILGLGLRDVTPEQWAREYGLYLPDRKTPFPTDRLPLLRAMQGADVDGERMYVRAEGSVRGAWISVNARPLRDRSGSITGGVAVFRDITESVHAERTVKRLSSAVEATADVVFVTDRDGTLLYVNPAFESVTGYSREEVLGATPRLLKSGHHDAAFYETMWETLLRGEVFRGSTVNRRKNGELFFAEQTITPIRDASGRVSQFVAVVKDMTERRQAQAREIEMNLARIVQSKLYPKSSPRIAHCDIAGAVFPATALCGDYLDYVEMPDGATGILVGDVCGHGLGSALVMSETRAYLRSMIYQRTDFGPIFTRINNLLVEDLTESSYVAMLAVRFDPARRRLAYCNAGHAAGYVLTRAGDVKAVLKSSNVPLGLFAGRVYACSEEIALDPGDLLMMFTDGVMESGFGGDDAFGDDRALQIVRANRAEPSRRIIHHVYEAARKCAGDSAQQDDMTLAVCKFEW